jgi:hypothetical protein
LDSDGKNQVVVASWIAFFILFMSYSILLVNHR